MKTFFKARGKKKTFEMKKENLELPRFTGLFGVCVVIQVIHVHLEMFIENGIKRLVYLVQKKKKSLETRVPNKGSSKDY